MKRGIWKKLILVGMLIAVIASVIVTYVPGAVLAQTGTGSAASTVKPAILGVAAIILGPRYDADGAGSSRYSWPHMPDGWPSRTTTPIPGMTSTATPALIPVQQTVTGFDVFVAALVQGFHKGGEPSIPGQGHYVYYMDIMPDTVSARANNVPPGNYVSNDNGAYVWMNVNPGWHVFTVELVNNDFSPLNPPVVAGSFINVPSLTTVVATPAPTGTRPVTPTPTPYVSGTPAATVGPLSTGPSIKITTPSNNATLPFGPLFVCASVQNFNLVNKSGQANVAGEGHIVYYLDSMMLPMNPGQTATPAAGTYFNTTDACVAWNNVTAGKHVVYAQLVNNDNTPLNPPVIAMLTVTIQPAQSSTPSSTR